MFTAIRDAQSLLARPRSPDILGKTTQLSFLCQFFSQTGLSPAGTEWCNIVLVLYVSKSHCPCLGWKENLAVVSVRKQQCLESGSCSSGAESSPLWTFFLSRKSRWDLSNRVGPLRSKAAAARKGGSSRGCFRDCSLNLRAVWRG